MYIIYSKNTGEALGYNIDHPFIHNENETYMETFIIEGENEDIEDEIIYGNILAVRMNEESQHENLFKVEIIEYIENTLKNRRSRRNSSEDDAEKGEVHEETQCGPGNNGPSPKRTRSGLRFGN